MPFKRIICLSPILISVASSFVFDVKKRIGSRTLNTGIFAPKIITKSSHLYYNDKNEGNYENMPSWWISAEVDLEEPKSNEERDQKTKKEKDRFAQGEQLKELRTDLQLMKQNLHLSLATDDLMRVVALTKSIKDIEKKDPELVYSRALEMIAGANQYNTRKKYEIISRYNREAKAARAHIPRLNMYGLWVANFGKGSELVNVTYTGDVMIGTRLKNKGGVCFESDLSPSIESAHPNLAPIKLDSSVASKWGVEKLERYAGKARDTLSKRSANTDFLDGNLIVFDGYFSFLWIPTRQHVFFSRPKSETIVKLMRDSISAEDETANMMNHVSKCFEKNIDEAFVRPSNDREAALDPFRRIAREADLAAAKEETQIIYDEFPVREIPQESDKIHQSFWGLHKWMNYIEKVLKPNELENN